MLNSESNLIKLFNPLIKNFVDKKIDLESKSRINRTISDEISSILDFLLIVLIIYLLMIKNITPALALVLFNYSINLGKITGILENLFEYIQDFNLSSERIQELFDDKKFKKEKFGKKNI